MPAESQYTQPKPDCPNPELWWAPDEWASESEVGDFLYGLIRLLKPKTVLETGCYQGHTTVRMGQALRENKYGILYTCDIEKKHVERVTGWTQQLNLPVVVKETTGEILAQNTPDVNLAFIDGGGRLQECEALQLAPGAFVTLHDSRWPIHQIIGKAMGWQEVFFPCPRGLSLYATGHRES